jgi:pimeloyl-ACP methyl ester carboxylesterase
LKEGHLVDATSERERAEIVKANASGRTPVVFVHGLWLLANSWESWRGPFEEAGYVTLAPGWPDDPETVDEARHNTDALAGKRVAQVVEHYADVCRRLRARPAIVGHSFGGLFAMQLAGMGLSAATVAIAPAPFRGVLPLPVSSLRSSAPVLKNPANWTRAVGLTFPEFRYAFSNALSEGEARELYERYSVPGAGATLIEAATANLNPWTTVKVDTANRERGPLLIISSDRDHTVPLAVAHAAFARERRNPSVTEFQAMRGRGHSLTIDSGWREVASVALAFLSKYHPARAVTEEERRIYPVPGEGPHPNA